MLALNLSARYSEVASIYYEKKRFDDTIYICDRALAFNENNEKAWTLKDLSLLEKDRSLLEKVQSLLNEEKFQNALECCEEAIKSSNGKYIFAMCCKGLALDYLKQDKLAGEAYDAANEIDSMKVKEWIRKIEEKHKSVSTVHISNRYMEQRQAFSALEPISNVPPAEHIEYEPVNDCLTELRNLSASANMNNLNGVIDFCHDWTNDFLHRPRNSRELSPNEILAICIYTHNVNNSPREDNFYYKLNGMLRKRQTEEYNRWRGYLHYLLTALTKFPNQQTTVYRGIPPSEMEVIQKEYTLNRPIFWSGFTSTTPTLAIAQGFATTGGIVVRIRILNGKDIREYSIYGATEEEILVLPNSGFKVTRPLHQEGDFYYVDLEQQRTRNTMFIS